MSKFEYIQLRTAVLFCMPFLDDANPYESKSVDTDFFTFGFLKDTKLYIADSLVEEVSVTFYCTMLRNLKEVV